MMSIPVMFSESTSGSSSSSGPLKMACPLLLLLVIIFVTDQAADAVEQNCLQCHKSILSGRFLHRPLNEGCVACHKENDMPRTHGKTNGNAAKGLVTDSSALCFKCHDRRKFVGRFVHAPVSMGYCTGCHDPHGSVNAKHLRVSPEKLCLGCHEIGGFAVENVHGPVAAGMCLICHSPHSSTYSALLLERPGTVCFKCHPDVTKERHVIGDRRHPLGAVEKEGRTESHVNPRRILDPAGPWKEFYCGSCHDPHGSNSRYFLRYNAMGAYDLCDKCHDN